MKRKTTSLFYRVVISHIMLMVLLTLLTTLAYAQQTRLLNTTTPATAWGAITFRLTTTTQDIVVDTIFCGSDGTAATLEVWYKPTGLNAQPVSADFAPPTQLWFNAIAGQAVGTGLAQVALVIPGGLKIPKNSQYGIYIGNTSYATTGVRYASTVPTPDSVFNSQASIRSGTNTGFGWVRNGTTTNHPRAFCGGISYHIPTYGPNNASISNLVSPSGTFCPGNKDVQVKLRNTGTNILSNVTIQWKLDNVLQTPVSWTSPLDTIGGSLFPSDTVITLATNIPFLTTRTIQAWTEFPNSVPDTTNADDSIKVTLAPAISGNFTIGGTSPDFATIQAAVTMLKTAGVCGPVHFTVRPGTYSGQINLSGVAGVSAINTITFEGIDKATTIVTYAAATGDYATWTTDNVSFVTLRNLTINATHATNAWGIRLNNAHNCRIINCNVNAPVSSGTASMGIVVAGSPTGYTTAGRADNLEIDSVTVTGGYYCISNYGASAAQNIGLKLTNSKMIDYYNGGLYLVYSTSLTVSNNIITHLNPTASTYGMYLSSLGNAGGVPNTFTNNYINTIGSYGMYFTTATNPSATNKGIIANNVVTGIVSIYGIYVSGGTNWRIAHNTSYFKTNATTITYVPAYITGGSAITCVNNIFRTLSNTAYSFYGSAATIFDTLNYNVYSKDLKGANYFYLGSAYTDVTLIGAGSRNANSITLNPDFTSDNNLTPKRVCLAGTAVSTVATDYTGMTRNIATPTMGAYEVTPVATDARAEQMIQPTMLTTIGLQDATVLIRNEGTTALTSVDVTIKVNGRAPVTTTWSGFLAQCDTVSVLFTGSNQVIFDSISKVTVYTSNPNVGVDLNKNNDTLKTNMYAPMSGLYTIGGPGASFNDIIEAVSVLKLAGVVAPVTFRVNPGTYSGQVYMNLIPGVSATNTITFEGVNKATTIVTHSFVINEYATWIIDNVSYVTLKNMTINATHATNAWGVRLNNAHNCKIISCNVNAPVYSGSSSMGIVVAGSGTSYTTAGRADSLTIDSVTVTGGYMSISSYGASTGINIGLKLTNNKLLDYYYAGLYQYYSSSINIIGNTITHLNPTASTYGMYLSSLGNASNVANNFSNNIITSIGSYGMYFTTATNPSAANKGIIANNIINGGSTIYGLYMTAGTNWRIAHNSILFNNINTTVTYVPAYLTGGSGLAVFNNIFRTLKTTGYTFYGSATTIFDTLNYNVYSKDLKGANYFYLGAAYTDVTLVGVGTWNNNSSTANPAFSAEATGNFVPLSSNIDNIAILAPSIPTDITGALRSVTTPDVGSYEFTGIAGDMRVVNASLKRASACYSTNDTIAITVQNLLGTTADFSVDPLTVNWNITGPVNSSGTTTITTGTLAVGSDYTVLLPDANRSAAGMYTLKVYISSNAINLSTLNDTFQNITSEVKPILSVTPKTATVTGPADTVVLLAGSPLFPGGGIFFSEICHFKTTVGQPTAGWPTYLVADDYIELTGVPNSDLAGYILEEWNATGLEFTTTFPSGTLFSPNGTMIIATGQLGASVPVPASYYYHSGNTTTTHGSTVVMGYILKNSGGTIIDAVVYGSLTFPAAAGVTLADWSGTTPAVSSSGNRINAPDNNTNTCWINSGTAPQDPNVLNAGITAPLPGTLTGFDWNYLGTSFSTSPKVTVGPYTTPGVYTYVASYSNACGTFYDTVRVTAAATVPVKLTTFTATKANADVNLNWNTASEVNNNRFEVERSTNGRDFKAIGRVKGMGTKTTASRYAFTDEGIVRNTTSAVVYYRLKQVDNDGTFTYSKVEAVRLSNKGTTTITTRPNPSNGTFTIVAEGASSQSATIKVVNIMGATVWSQTLLPNSTNSFDVQLQLPDGMYMLLMEQDGETTTHKLLIQQ